MTDSTLGAIEERVQRRRENWFTEETPVLPAPEDMNEPTIVSMYSRCGMETHRRFLRSDVLLPVSVFRETPSAVARDYLMIKYRTGPKWTGSQRSHVRGALAPMSKEDGENLLGHPLYVKPSTFSEGVYIDLKAAYWSVMVRVGWNVDYYPGLWVGHADPPLDFPFQDNKRARNSLVSIGIARRMTTWYPNKGYEEKVRPNPRANSQLYCLIMDTLHGMAAEIVAAGAVYVFADGYIAPDYNTGESIVQIIKDWGFDFSIKGTGPGWVTNIGSYRVGTHKTKGTLSRMHQRSIKEIAYHSWLRERMAWARSEAHWHDGFVYREAA